MQKRHHSLMQKRHREKTIYGGVFLTPLPVEIVCAPYFYVRGIDK